MHDNIETKSLYTRKIEPVPQRPIKNGVPLFGSYDGYFPIFDIKNIYRPFRHFPLPTMLTNLRIAESMRLLFCSDDIIGDMQFFSCLSFCFMETVFYLRKVNQKAAYRQYLPPRFIHLPKHIGYSVTACRKESRYAKIFSRISHGKIHADFDFLAFDSRPACEGRIDFDCRSKGFADYSCVMPYHTTKRCQAAYMCCCPVEGWLSLAHSEDIQLNKEFSAGFFDFRKVYAGIRGKRSIIYGLGKIEGKMTAFSAGGTVSPDPYNFNDNILFFDSERTPLPPVTITHPYGIKNEWIIQDTENMVDLVFKPLSLNYKKVNALVFKTEYNSIYGNFEGFLLNSKGKQIKLKEFPGVIKNYNLRF